MPDGPRNTREVETPIRRPPGWAVERATELRCRVAEQERRWYERTEELLDPFRPRRDGGPPKRAPKHLRRLAQSWQRLGGFGRLRCIAKVDGAGGWLQILETRLLCTQASLASWQDGKTEPGISIGVRTVAIEPPRRFGEAVTFLLSIGDHGVARFYERAEGAADVELISELSRIAAEYPSLAAAGGHFRLAGSVGTWAGMVIERNAASADRLLRVQTLLPNAPRYGFTFEQVARLLP